MLAPGNQSREFVHIDQGVRLPSRTFSTHVKLTTTYEIKGECLRVRAAGNFDLVTARPLVAEAATMAREHGLRKILCDLTAVNGLDAEASPLMERFELCKAAADSFSRGLVLAIVGTPQQLTKDQFEESVMLNRGATVKVTAELDKALEWLEAQIPGPKADAPGRTWPRPHSGAGTLP